MNLRFLSRHFPAIDLSKSRRNPGIRWYHEGLYLKIREDGLVGPNRPDESKEEDDIEEYGKHGAKATSSRNISPSSHEIEASLVSERSSEEVYDSIEVSDVAVSFRKGKLPHANVSGSGLLVSPLGMKQPRIIHIDTLLGAFVISKGGIDGIQSAEQSYRLRCFLSSEASQSILIDGGTLGHLRPGGSSIIILHDSAAIFCNCNFFGGVLV